MDTLPDREEVLKGRVKMSKVVSIQHYNKKEFEKKTGVIRKPGSNKLYIDLRYNGRRIQKTTGLADTPGNRDKVQKWVDKQKRRIEDGTFCFTEAFPAASAREKAIHARIEGRVYMPEPNDILFKDYLASWQTRFFEKFDSLTKKRDYSCSIQYWILPFFGNLTFYQITGEVVAEFIGTLKHRRGNKKGMRLSPQRIGNILIPLRSILRSARVAHRWELKISDPFEYLELMNIVPTVTKSVKNLVDKFVSRSVGDHMVTLENGEFFNDNIFRKRWIRALKKAQVDYRKPYATRHTYAAWALVLDVKPYRLVALMGHGSKKMVYETYGKYRDGLEADAGAIRAYFGKDFK
jgi:hypothetical protein